jgi:DNA polymerase-3 subunit delta'
MAFKDIVGNERIKHILRRSLEKQRLPNSLLFCGPRGVGKRRMAFVLAKALCCQRLKDDACEECVPCRFISEGESKGENKYPDVMLILPNPKKSDIIEIDTIRSIKEIAYIRPLMGTRRVFIIDGAETDYLPEEGSNAILKILEEPPSFTHLILIADNADKVLPTIKSRCRILSFSPISQFDIEKALRDKGLDEDKAKILSVLSRGNLEQALDMDWAEVSERRQAAWRLFRALIRRENASEFLESYGYLKRKDAEKELPAVLEIFSSFGRDLILIKEGGSPDLLLNPDFEALLRQETEAFSLEQALHFLARVDTALTGLDRSLNVGLLVSTLYSSIIEGP